MSNHQANESKVDLTEPLAEFWRKAERFNSEQNDLTDSSSGIRVESGSPDGWAELWNDDEEDGDPVQDSFTRFVDLTDGERVEEAWLLGDAKESSGPMGLLRRR